MSSGPERSPLDEAVLEQLLAEVEQARSWSPRVMSRLETFLRTADDYDLFRINPLAYASARGMSEAEAIELFVHASRVGLFQMDWQLLCAYCPQIAGSFRELEKVHGHFQCSFCNSMNDVALDDYIQVTFTLSPSVRDNVYLHPERLSVEDYYLRYHFARGFKAPEGLTVEGMLAMLTKLFVDIAPHETARFEFTLPAGRFEVMDLAHGLLFVLFVDGSGSDAEHTRIELEDGRFHVVDRSTGPRDMVIGPAQFAFRQVGDAPPGHHTIEIENRMDERGRFWIIQYPPGFEPTRMEYEPFLSGKRLLITPAFRRLYRNQLVDDKEGLTVHDLTYLFSDLQGSTRLYDVVGDVNAYFLVRQHFEILNKVVERWSGIVVKTIGDAIMAAFEEPANAVSAGIDMIGDLESFNRNIPHPMRLKIGIHRGRSIAVTLNDRIDYFGQDVNIAARLQGMADGNEIWISREVKDGPGVHEILEAHHVSSDAVRVKGVAEKLDVFRVVVTPEP